ncbi:hypothetical protein SAMN05421837_101832 [Amycolatopsis pretoriensis]|uniref:Uncharacterized protein n=1 Tax=Amycolatopsis pretoriensis TaxID=218821 RepID=A0A1H5Q7Y4_9PSEU|nr:hypothetical protein SAMN05421837_101832 [Amycolatopsis pretoriensis]
MPGLLLRDGHPWRAGGPADLLVRDGVVAKIGPGLVPGTPTCSTSAAGWFCRAWSKPTATSTRRSSAARGGRIRPGPRRPTASPTNASAAPSPAFPTRPA